MCSNKGINAVFFPLVSFVHSTQGVCSLSQNVSPAHMPEIIIFLDAIAIVSEEEASKCGPPLLLPIASIETGNGHSLPDLPLRFFQIVPFCCFSIVVDLLYSITDVHQIPNGIVSWNAKVHLRKTLGCLR